MSAFQAAVDFLNEQLAATPRAVRDLQRAAREGAR